MVTTAIILIPIALLYGLAPERTLSYLFQIEDINLNLKNMLRSVMGFYLALAVFWITAALFDKFKIPALLSLAIFMFGVSSGRLISVLFDGVPNWILVFFTISELLLGVTALFFIKQIKTLNNDNN